MSMYESGTVVPHVALPAMVTQTEPAPPQSGGVQPATIDWHWPVSLMHTAPLVQKAARQGPFWSIAASSKVQSVAALGTATFPCASVAFERIMPMVPGS